MRKEGEDEGVAAVCAQAGLSFLTRALLGRELAKGDRKTNWEAPELTSSQVRVRVCVGGGGGTGSGCRVWDIWV